ncbi:S1C family serine protease [Labedaea rhizosphaerae]|uniref:S1-C subfamily serine protease n=1 Tax=Labedaea rhizosphaerae TaxID=598644 RepID=A0A4R6S2G9_LABRH|nr:trypsin-like peptidase domain-containing protein [Labedaea rhizosphaerae]TDP93819.1 S1-C subfamily serine protease [Labedaea rhizosphaerae]
MTEQHDNDTQPEAGRIPADQRVGPRPLERPPVDPGAAAVFARPNGVQGAFAPTNANHLGGIRSAPPPPQALVSAFSRPPTTNGETLQRPPGEVDEGPDAEDPMWSGSSPWRDPGAGAVVGPPALDPNDDEPATKAKPKGPLLSLPELLFGRRVKPVALILLAVVALLIGTAGGALGFFLGKQGDSLTDDGVSLATVSPAKERPAGSVADIAHRVTPAVVSIEIRGNQVSAVGSGVVIDGKGYVLTNFHVVDAGSQDSSAKITAVFTNGKRVPAQVVGTDPKTDLAVIKVDLTDLTVIQFGNSDDLQVGDEVIAIGSPLGLADTVTSGIVSALHRPVTADDGAGGGTVTYDAIQTDAAINHGNSGGALVDTTGALVGINSAIRSGGGEDSGSIGLGFAIPVNDARKVAESLIRTGKVAHADLGVNVRSVSAETAEGAQVVNVVDGGAAKQAGIREGDVIRKVGDRPVRNAPELTVAVREHNPGDTVPVELARQGRDLTVQVTLRSD